MAKGHRNNITKLLGLEGLRVLGVVEEKEIIVIKVQPKKEKEIFCPHCASKHLYRHGKAKPRRVLHAYVCGKRIYLKIQGLQRWKCRRCDHTFTHQLEILRPKSRLTNTAEMWVLWLLKHTSFKEVSKMLGISYGRVKKVLMEALAMIKLPELVADDLKGLHIGIDEHSFRHQEMVIVVTDVRAKRVLGILKDDRLSTLEEFLKKIPPHKVKEVCIDMKEGFRKLAQRLFPKADVVVDHFHVIANANKYMDEARRIEQDVTNKGKVKIPKKIFLVGFERLSEEGVKKLDELLSKYPNLKDFYWAKEKLRKLYSAKDKGEASKQLELVIMNLKASDDAEARRWANTLKRWQQPILNYFDNKTTNAYTEGCNTKIKMLKRLSFGLRNIEVYTKKMMLGFLPQKSFHTI